jgi:hypothetical protein
VRPGVGRLLLTALLFVGWLGYLGYLVATRPLTVDDFRQRFWDGGQPLVLSRPQLLVSDLDVIAHVDDPTKPVVVREVLYPAGEQKVLPGNSITVANLGDCRPPPREAGQPAPADWTGPGDYLLPLLRWTEGGETRYKVAPTPPSPGYPPQRGLEPGPPRIYPDKPQTRAQYSQIHKPG